MQICHADTCKHLQPHQLALVIVHGHAGISVLPAMVASTMFCTSVSLEILPDQSRQEDGAVP